MDEARLQEIEAELTAELAAPHGTRLSTWPRDMRDLIAEVREAQGCICAGNWRAIVKGCEHLIGRRYRRERDGHEFRFFGVVHGDDDYYYGMYSHDHGCPLLSCVGSIEGFGYELIPEDEPRAKMKRATSA